MVRDSLSQAQNDAKSTWNTINEYLAERNLVKLHRDLFFK